jgi:NADPH2:quinone reductase
MLAAVLREYGSPENLVVEYLPDPEPSPDQVVVRVRACGVNYPDLLIVQNRYQTKVDVPFIPGAEVRALLRPSDPTWRAGRRGTGLSLMSGQVVSPKW